MSDGDSLLLVACATPKNATPRLALADWLAVESLNGSHLRCERMTAPTPARVVAGKRSPTPDGRAPGFYPGSCGFDSHRDY